MRIVSGFLVCLSFALLLSCQSQPANHADAEGTSATPSKKETANTSANGVTRDVNLSECDDSGLIWKNAQKTHYTSYPDPGSEECIKYSGCKWEGLFAGCEGKQPEAWVESTNIAAIFPHYGSLQGHRLCLRSGSTRMIVNVIDTCADSDCSGCCTRNLGDKDALVDLESYTNARWALPDGEIEWADLGAAPSPCN